MTQRKRPLEKMARQLFEILNSTPCTSFNTVLPLAEWQECVRLSRLVRKAQTRGWRTAAEHFSQHFVAAQQTLTSRLTVMQQALQLTSNASPRPTVRDLHLDLKALQDEFVSVEYDPHNHQLTVTTEEIVLDDLHLGPFAIVLECDRLSNASPFRVEATDANPASVSSQTTHPHVQDDTLCEGEGRVPLERALRQGRLFDFFLIVRQILSSYNPESAYVSIADWHGIACHDCGGTMVEEDRESCFRCETDLCSDCSYGCQSCSERFCNGCTEACEVCHEYYCQACLQTCSECELLYCEGCRTVEKCPNCVEKQEAEANFSSTTNPSVHAVRVGQVVVSS